MAINLALGAAATLLKPSKKDIAGDAAKGIARGISFNVTSDMKRFERKLNNFQKRQLPFAFSKTINDTIFAVRKRIVTRTMPRAFEIRNKRFVSATWRVDKSSKTKLAASLFDKLDRGNLRLHAEGGTRRSRSGSIAIPSRKWVQDKRTGKGVPKRLRPRNVNKAYLEENKRGKFIYQEYGPKRNRKRKTLFTLKSSVRIDKSFPFFEDANKVARRQFDRRFSVNFKKALRTAR